MDAGRSDPYDSRFILHRGSGKKLELTEMVPLSPLNSVFSDSYPNSPRLYVLRAHGKILK